MRFFLGIKGASLATGPIVAPLSLPHFVSVGFDPAFDRRCHISTTMWTIGDRPSPNGAVRVA